VSNDGCLSSLKNHNHWEDDCVLPKGRFFVDMSASRCQYLNYFGAVELAYSITTLALYKIVPRDMRVFSSPPKDITIAGMAAFSSN